MTLGELTPVSWDALWSIEGLVAIGTLVLASVTVGLAVFTARVASKTGSLGDSTATLARLTEREVDLSRVAIEANLRPVLIGALLDELAPSDRARIPVGPEGTRRVSQGEIIVEVIGGDLVLSVPFRNEGPGIAFPQTVAVAFASDPATLHPGEVNSNPVPHGERVRMTFARPQTDPGVPDDAELQGDGVFTVRVTYSDLAGNIWASEQNFDYSAGRWEPSEVKVTNLGRMALPDPET